MKDGELFLLQIYFYQEEFRQAVMEWVPVQCWKEPTGDSEAFDVQKTMNALQNLFVAMDAGPFVSQRESRFEQYALVTT